MKRYLFIGQSVLLLFLSGSCTDAFLDQNPDLGRAIPKTLADCEAILADYNRMTATYSDHAELAADNFYLEDPTYGYFATQLQNETYEITDDYAWNSQGMHVSAWLNAYQVVFSANLVLKTLEKIDEADASYKKIKGSALFFRAFAFYHIAQLFCKPYDAATAGQDLGIPLRLDSDPNGLSTRATVRQTYDQIVQDLTEAIGSLSAVNIKTEPSKAAAYAALARTYLAMGDYPEAGRMADECLKLQSTLIDYNETSDFPTETTVNAGPFGPAFLRFNAEIIFHATTAYGVLSQEYARIDPILYTSYAANDRRKTIFFGEGKDWLDQPNGLLGFRGNYNGTDEGINFIGLATDEMYLIRAESHARAGSTQLAMDDLNTLLEKRMIPPYVDRTATSANNALVQILAERRKELVFRSLRWTDLRRLNKDPQFAVTLRRDQNSFAYTPLLPNDLRYTFLIPFKQVIQPTGMKQNLR